MSTKMVKILIIFLIIYLFISYTGLERFPFVHSDETWLSSLSNEMLLSNTIKTTEPSFDLYPRHPHAIKLLFNFIQIVFIKLFGHTILTLRSISLLFSIAGACLFLGILTKLARSRLVIISIFVSLLINIQFVYMSHFARQEALLFFFLLLNLYYLHRRESSSPVVSGIISGLAIGIHPNSFIIFLPVLTFWLFTRRWKDLFKYLITVASFAVLFVSFSYLLDPHFLHHYLNYGETLGVNSTLLDKIFQIRYFYLKLYYGVSGTYYTPDIRIYFYISAATLCIGGVQSLMKKIDPRYLAMLFAVNIGYVLIGRYNQTSIIFCLPLILLIILQILDTVTLQYGKIALFLLILFSSVNTYGNLLDHPQSESYSDYIANIQEYVPDNSIVLGNLNTLLAFENSQVYDYRNLAFLEENIRQYLLARDVAYIVYPTEMDFIYSRRPLWNALYGNLYPYYNDLQEFFDEDCELIGEFVSPIYAMRIVRYIETEPFSIRIYKVR